MLVLFVIYRRNEVAILNVLGASAKFRQRLFSIGGMLLGLKGVVLGIIVGLAIALFVGKTGIIRIPADIYFISKLPIDITPILCGIIAITAIFICWITSNLAAKRVSCVLLGDAFKNPS